MNDASRREKVIGIGDYSRGSRSNFYRFFARQFFLSYKEHIPGWIIMVFSFFNYVVYVEQTCG